MYKQTFTVTIFSETPVKEIQVQVPDGPEKLAIAVANTLPPMVEIEVHDLALVGELRYLEKYQKIVNAKDANELIKLFGLKNPVRACAREHGEFPIPGSEKIFDITSWLQKASAKDIRQLLNPKHKEEMGTKIAKHYAKKDPELKAILGRNYSRTAVFEDELICWIKENRPRMKIGN